MGTFGVSFDLASPTFATTDDDRRILMDAVLMRLSTRKGTFWADPDYGYQLSDLVKAGLTDDALARIPGDVAAEIEKDRRVRTARVTPTTEATGQRGGVRLRLVIEVTPVTGPDVSFAVSVDALTVQLLTQESG